ncbi:MAG: cell division protein ZapA [Rhodospirillaceae bacterium]|nr:cell division protein ZapA [Rhodospirillaceae bacterium]
MSQVSITINGRKYQVACDDGQEAHLTRLGDYVDKRLDELVAAVGQVGDSRLLVMVSLLLADELSDLYSENESLKSKTDGGTSTARGEEELAVAVEKIAERIENIAAGLEQA